MLDPVPERWPLSGQAGRDAPFARGDDGRATDLESRFAGFDPGRGLLSARRGRTVESVIKQYLETVRPMHQQFVEPSKRYADVIIPEGGYNEVGIDLISGKIRAQLQKELSKSKP